jgi:hypothetical protein
VSSSNFDILRKYHQTLIKPGTIWRLPVHYSLNYLPETVWFEDEEICRETDKNILHSYWHDKNLSYKSVYSEIVGMVEVRPFLVISDFADIKKAGDLFLPTWYSNAVIGFPITKTENLRKIKDLKFDLETAITSNDSKYLHFLTASNENGLFTNSYVAMSAITFLDKEFFTEKIGDLDREYNLIIEKFKALYSL